MEEITIFDKLGDVSDTLAGTITRFQEYLEARGYTGASHLAEMFFSVYGASDPRVMTLPFEKMEPVLSTLAVGSKEEHFRFHDDYTSFIRNEKAAVVDKNTAGHIGQMKKAYKKFQKNAESYAKRADECRKRITKLESETEKRGDPLISDTEKARLDKMFAAVKKDYDKVYRQAGSYKYLKALVDRAADGESMPKDAIDMMKRELKDGLPRCVTAKNAGKLVEFVKKQERIIEKMQNAAKKNTSVIKLENERLVFEAAMREKENAEKRMEEILSDIESAARISIKKQSVQNRKNFVSSGNSVISDSDGVINKEFAALSEKEREEIGRYIHENAVRLKTRISRRIRTGNRRIADIPCTIKSACKTNGIPIDIKYVKPKRGKTNVIMILDISGSCRNASEMMLAFMHEMQDIFPGGCRTYVFVNSLYDITDIFRESRDVRSAVRMVFDTIPTKGVYSNYNNPLKQFYEDQIHTVSSDSIVILIGDARNNSNPTGEEYIKNICRRAKKAYWLNTEKAEKWNVNDSIIGIYAPYMTRVIETLTTENIIEFLTGI